MRTSFTDDENSEKLFPKNSPVYTKIRDDNPTRCVTGSKVVDSIVWPTAA